MIVPTLYWSIIEASLNIVAACLPKLGPLVAGFSVESAVRSVRSAISLRSFGSRASSNSKHSNGSRTVKSRHMQVEGGSTSSAAAIQPAVGLDTYALNAVETEVFSETHAQEKSGVTRLPKNRIMVEDAMDSQDEYV